jgi:hypothetical protein
MSNVGLREFIDIFYRAVVSEGIHLSRKKIALELAQDTFEGLK